MAIWSPVTWVPWIPWIGVGYVAWDAASPGRGSSHRAVVSGLVYLVITCIASFWQGQVTEIVTEPYLDEIFHIPQAQAYCVGDFHVWDPKLTTPPGLYAFATVFGNLGGIRSCDVYTLRLFNVLVLIGTMAYASDCRALITRAWRRHSSKDEREEPEHLSLNVLHTASNIALFPPLFFFSGLFYTDVISTGVVLRMYRLFLQQKGSAWLYLAGILALTMRQTNIFWVAVYMGGMEVVRTIKSIKKVPLKQTLEPRTWKDTVLSEFNRYSQGEIHDVLLKEAEPQDFILCAISIAVAIVYHPVIILQRLWPYLALLISFASFVFWNGGVVLGDKSNHVATIHLPQMLYLFPFIAFFSLPLLIPSIISLLQPFLSLLIPSFRPVSTSSTAKPTFKLLLSITFTMIALLLTLLTIHFNTLIHPFTLADNRHYIFYIFRYSILFHPLIRYLLAPIYILAFWLCYKTLCSPSSSQTPAPAAFSAKNTGTAIQRRMHEKSHERRVQHIDNGACTSFLLIWVLTTALSLITAPLVEPRYFIIPWVIWRLHVPSWGVALSGRKAGRRGVVDGGRFWGYDYRLWIETGWLLAVNAVTGYVFLFRGFTWPQEPGKVQRFMW